MTQTHASRIRERQTPPQTISRSLISLFTLFWLFWDAAEMYSCHLKLWDIGWNTWRGSRKKRKVNLVLGFNILCNFWNLSPNRSFDCRAKGSEELCFNFKGAHFQQRLQTFIALWTRSKLSNGFVKIDTWISLSCSMDFSKLIHRFLLVVTWTF